MGFFSKLLGRDVDEKVKVKDDSVSAFIGAPGKGISREEAQRLQAVFLDHLTASDDSAAINAAAKLLVGGHYQEAIAAYTRIGEKWPERRDDCESQIGAAHFFLGEYEVAIQHYEEARKLGADPSMMEDNIVEARDAIKKRKS
jgi:tetratricopeptide (TPR) repeat protein